jgi:hypothetical protein
MEVFQSLLNRWEKKADKRASEWFLISNPYFIVGLVSFYALTAKVKTQF